MNEFRVVDYNFQLKVRSVIHLYDFRCLTSDDAFTEGKEYPSRL